MAEHPTFPPHTTGSRTPLTVPALLATMRRHVALFKNDPEFVDYVVNLALYLLEVQSGNEAAQTPEPRTSQSPDATPSTLERLTELAKRPATDVCTFCGAPSEGRRVCPQCGHMAA